MHGFDTPTVLMTRPKANSDAFVADLRVEAGPFCPLISPAFEVEGTAGQTPDFDVAIFSSRAAIRFAPQGEGRLAFCVGDATATDATRAGYKSLSARGAFDDLIALILEVRPIGHLLHLRGETTVGDLCGALCDAGLVCDEAVIYRKVGTAPIQGVKDAIASREVILLPVFSAETVTYIERWHFDFSGTHVIAISPAVARAAQRLSPASTTVAAEPDQVAMTAATARMIT